MCSFFYVVKLVVSVFLWNGCFLFGMEEIFINCYDIFI